MILRNFIAIALVVVLAACGGRDAVGIEIAKKNGIINLAEQLQGNWDRVCVLTPYISTSRASDLLGFFYTPEMHSAIAVRDDISILITALGNEVVGSYEVNRGNVDFASLGAGCFTRSKAVFRYVETEDGRHSLFPT